MLLNYIKIAIRVLLKFKLYAFVNIFGLALGIASFFLIFSFFYSEMTYDNFHEKSENIYRIYTTEKTPAGIEKKAETPDPLAETLQNEYPSLHAVSLSRGIKFLVAVDNKLFKEEIIEADPDFFSFFNFPFVQGNPHTALSNPSSVVLTEELASKYFGKENAIGKTVILLNKYPLIVSGVLKNIPANSNIQLNAVVSTEFRKQFIPGYRKQWHSFGKYTFVRCPEKFTVAGLKDILSIIKDKYLPDYLKNRMSYDIQSLQSIHLNTDIPGGIVPAVSKKYLYSLLAIALSIIIIASINFMNLTASRSSERLKEINIRKILGGKKSQIMIQLLAESVLSSGVAFIIGVALAEVFLPEFNRLVGKNLILFKFSLANLIYLCLFCMLIGIFSGLYPALLLPSSGTVEALRVNKLPFGKINIFRKVLLTAQFVISIILISSILIIARQIQYMKNFNLGFNKENVLVIPFDELNPGDGIPQAGIYKNELDKNNRSAGIINAAISEHTPGYYYNNEFGVIPEGWDKSQSIVMVVTSIDENFLRTYNIPLVEGRNFSDEFGLDKSQAILINETAASKMGWKTAIGRTITFSHGDGPYRIIGVIKDLHYKSLQNKIEPLIFRYAGYGYLQNFISVRISPSNISQTINYLKQMWQKLIPGQQFEYFFIDKKYNESYQSEERTAEIIGIFSFLAIVLANLGLLGLIALAISQKTKEIGIRKVLGASVQSIFVLMSKQFIKIILVAGIAAFPVTYLLMNRWLAEYPYRITLDISFFILSGAIVLLIALFTVSFHITKIAMTNPVKSLRYE